jgi:epoxyqueuosine reductase
MLENKIKAEARRLGFELVGITTPDPPPHFTTFTSWLNAGHHGEMHYLASPRSLSHREDPRRILPECQSILVLGMRHAFPESIPPQTQAAKHPDGGLDSTRHAPLPHADSSESSRGPLGRIASYAWGDDYHLVIPPLLQALVAFIENQVGRPVPNRYYTDTGPILERDLAQRAGLGWIGKNTCLINPRSGSYFLLAEVLLGLELTPDQPFSSDHCGSCTRCLDACPTQCILPDRTLDSNRCISYLTIELKTFISTELRSIMEDWVFGCDICQQVCPWNIRFANTKRYHQLSVPQNLAPLPGLPRPPLLQELSLTTQEFNQKFKTSPVKRAKRRGYLRNVAVALGNHKEAGSIPALSQALLTEPEPLVRAHCAWALAEIGTSAAIQAITQAEQVETDPSVLTEIRSALSKFNME